MNVTKVIIGGDTVWLEGVKGGWSTRQAFCDLSEVSGCIVALHAFNRKPMFIVKDREDLKTRLKERWPGATFE